MSGFIPKSIIRHESILHNIPTNKDVNELMLAVPLGNCNEETSSFKEIVEDATISEKKTTTVWAACNIDRIALYTTWKITKSYTMIQECA